MNENAGKEAMLSDASALMRNLVMFNQGLKELPPERTVSIKLKYFDHTPSEYGEFRFGLGWVSNLDRTSGHLGLC